MKGLSVFFFCLCLAFSNAPGQSYTKDVVPAISVFFSPDGGCTDAIVKNLGQAKSNVLVQAYSFTSAQIAEALVKVRRRGIHIEVILDKSQKSEKYSSADFLAHAGIKVTIDSEHRIAHDKVMIIDGSVVITGSFNFTKSAEKSNAENLLVIRSREVARKYTENWKKHALHSEEYKAK